MKRYFEDTWHTDDILRILPHLTDEQANELIEEYLNREEIQEELEALAEEKFGYYGEDYETDSAEIG